MRRLIALAGLFIAGSGGMAGAQDEVTIVAPTTEASEGLDLHAVAELFKEAESLEEFEKALNDPETQVNNLDLDEDGQVDYIRVVGQTHEDTHLVILRVPLSETESHDVAVIEIEKTGDDEANMQVTGDEEIYGADYYVAPATVVHISTWPVIRVMFRPGWRPWVSPWRWARYPRWWQPRPVLSLTVYRSRTAHLTKRAHFRHVQKRSVVRAHKRYAPTRSHLAKRKAKPVKAPPARATPAKAAPAKAAPAKQKPPPKKQAPKKTKRP